ncbi:MAG TPA: L,D-transpeptidase family protein [Acidimicrobiia bacterium]|nr:L,D-transpeptidase family protein [Acidimicrobiia bacterium]
MAAPAANATVTHDNEVYAFGSATFHGSMSAFSIARPIVAMATTANGKGYWLVASDGAVYSFNAPFYGALAGWPLAQPVTGITATPTGHGYWIVTGDGSVFPFGDAKLYGSLGGMHLNASIKALIPGPKGRGYWLYASDGGVFSFGSARFHGSTGAMHLNAPVVGMASTPSGKGYWLVASDGGIFTFGDAGFHGSTGAMRLNSPVVGMARDGSGRGYWLAGADGGVFTFGDAHYKGSAAGLVAASRRIVSLVGMPDGNGYRMLALARVADVGFVGLGSTGAAVADVQNRLIAMGYWLPGVNGVFDADMQQAVWAFQKANGLPRTGVVDAATQAAFRTATRPRGRSTSGSMIEIDKTRQILMVMQNGVARYTFNTSTGSDHPYVLDGVLYSAHTPEGMFSVIRQVNGPDHGPLGVLFRPKYFTWSGIAVHGYTSVPPYPASHGCARVSNDAINWIWANNILPLGMPVWVY